MAEIATFPIIIIDEDFKKESASGMAIRLLAKSLEEHEHPVFGGFDYEDALMTAKTFTNLSALLISIDGAEEKNKKQFDDLQAIVTLSKTRCPGLPIYLYGERRALDSIPMALLENIRGFLYLFEDTASFMASFVSHAAKEYVEDLEPPFFKELVDYTKNAKYSWHTPGHAGGVAFMKSPVGRTLHNFFGENTLRSDLSISVPELGSLLDHSGPVKTAEAEAAEAFNADMTFFVTNGTSAANKIVWHGIVGPGDIVLVDRNCHKSLVHVITMIGAIPIYFVPSRNVYGIIGPISIDQFNKKWIDQQIAASPLCKGIKNPRPRLAVVTNSTYDGICYSADTIKKKLDGVVDYLHFDEAWYAYARFHELYAGRFAMSDSVGRTKSTIFSTQSTHKLLAAFSQASMVHVKEGTEHKITHERFNEAFMMHTSTSPLYAIIASCSISARMMRGSAGRTLVQDTLDEAMSFRKAMNRADAEFESHKTWWFKVWQPGQFDRRTPAKAKSPSTLGEYHLEAKDWAMGPKDNWHGYGKVEQDFTMLDPIKVTILTPGIKPDGKLEKQGIPASVVTKFLWSRGIVVEKTGLYNFLVLFSMGITKGKWATLLTELMEFKRLYDRNALMKEALPELVHDLPGVYDKVGLRDFCQQQHDRYREHNTPKVQNDIYTVLPEQAMTPQAAYNKMIHGDVEEVALDKLQGRTLSTMIVPYPPGIPLIMAGEKITKATQSIIDYLKFCEEWDAEFPGFESDVHGVRRETRADGSIEYRIDCVKEK